MDLVTGSTGLVGSHLILDLLLKGKDVRAIRRKNSSEEVIKRVFRIWIQNDWQALYNKIEWVDGDVLDYASILHAMNGITDVYHCAGLVSYQSKDKPLLYEVNQKGTANMVNAALQHSVRKFCHVSSIAALGKPKNPGEWYTEDCFLQHGDSNTNYGYSKFFGEQEVWRGAEEGLQMVIVNPSVILGVGDAEKGSTKLFTKVYEGLKFYTGGSTGFVDVKDVTRAMIMLMESEVHNKRFILNGDNISFKTLFDMIAAGFGKKGPTIKAKPWMGEIYWRIDYLKSLLSGKQAVVTRETARTGQSATAYSNAAICNEIGFEFRPLRTTINEICTLLEADRN